MATGAETHVGPSSVAWHFFVIYALYLTLLFPSYSAGMFTVQSHCGGTLITQLLTFMNMTRSLCVVRMVLIVYWYDTCDRCFTLMM